MVSESLERQWFEYEALKAIFDGDEHITVEFSGCFEALRRCMEEEEEDSFSEADHLPPLGVVLLVRFPCSDIPSVRIHVPRDYPAEASPEIELANVFVNRCQGEVKEIVSQSQGDECLFQVIQLLKETVVLVKDELALRAGVDEAHEPGKENEEGGTDQGPLCGETVDDEISVVHGNAFTERKSTFQAHFAAVNSMADVEQVMNQLLSIKKLASCTHNMMAYRICDCDGGNLLQDYDDDGEAAAGSRLLHLLQVVKATNVIVVVSRWYGGIKLGPSRFSIINNVARELMAQCGIIKAESSKGKKGRKK